MNLLKRIRRNVFVNRLISRLIKFSSKNSKRFHSFLINRWPTSGITECEFENYNFKYYNACDDGLVNHFYYGVPFHESNDLKLFLILSKKAQTIVDIGANTGLFSVLAHKANPNAEIHSIEPYHTNAERLRKNLKINGSKNVAVHEIAIGELNGDLELSIPENENITDVSSANHEFSKSIYPEIRWKKKRVPSLTLDAFISAHNCKIDLIKCDVESFEMSVFKGAKQLLKEQKPTILFECFLDDERQLFFNSILKEYDYYLYVIMESGIVYMKEGFQQVSNGLNFIITAVKPENTYIPYSDEEKICASLLKPLIP